MASARAICGSSSTTRTRVTGAAPATGNDRTIVSPPPGVSSAHSRPPIALDEAARDGEPEAHTGPGGGVTEPLERREHLRLRRVGHAGTAVDDAQLDLVAQDARRHQDRGRDTTVAYGVLDQVGHHPLQQAGVTGDQRQRLGDLHHEHRGGIDAGERRRHDLLEGHRPELGLHRAGLQPAHVQQVGDQRVEPVGGLLDGGEQRGLVFAAPLDVLLAQAAHRGLDAGERRAQVVRDRRQQCGTDRVALLEPLRRERPLGQAFALKDDSDVRCVRLHDPLVVGRQRVTAQHDSESGDR